MLKKRIIPVLQISNNDLVKTVNFKKTYYLGDPVNAVRIFNQFEVDELIIVDINATAEKKLPDLKFIKLLAGESFIPVTYGGGINKLSTISELLRVGIEKVCTSTFAYNNLDFIRKASRIFGKQAITVSIDIRKIANEYIVFTHSGEVCTNIDVYKYALLIEKHGAGEILLNNIDRDGTYKGYDKKIINKLSRLINIPVIALGGAKDLVDIKRIICKTNVSGVCAGSLFTFQKKGMGVLINYPDKKDLKDIYKC